MKYIVTNKDSLSKIAQANGLTLSLLLSLNKDIKNPNLIRVGLQINLPDKQIPTAPNYTGTYGGRFWTAPELPEPFVSQAGNENIRVGILNGNLKLAKRDKIASRVKTPLNTLLIQEELWNQGAFNGITDRRGRPITYEQAVDGQWGAITEAAMRNAKSVKSNKTAPSVNTRSRIKTSSGAFMPIQVMENTSNSVRPYVEEAADFISNNPGLILLEDIDRASSNRFLDNYFGIRPFKGRTITSLPTLQKEELIKQVKFAKSNGKLQFDKDLFRLLYGFNYGSKDGKNEDKSNVDREGLWSRMNTPSARIEHTLGLYTFFTDENGNTIVTDTYDFNTNQSLHGDGKYAKVRNNFAGKYGSYDTDPDEGKIKYRINLGKI